MLGTATTTPYTTSWNTSNVSGGTHTLGARAYDTSGNTNFSYILVTVSTVAVGCQNLMVQVTNSTSHQITGGLWGAGLGSAGFAVGPSQVTTVGIPASNSNTGYGIEGHIQLVDGAAVNLVCQATLPSVSSCPPAKNPNAIMTISEAKKRHEGISCSMAIVP